MHGRWFHKRNAVFCDETAGRDGDPGTPGLGVVAGLVSASSVLALTWRDRTCRIQVRHFIGRQFRTNAVGVHQAEKAANIVCGHLRGTHRAGHSSAATTSRTAQGRRESRAPPRRHRCPRAARMAEDTRLRVGRAFAVQTHDAATSPDGRGTDGIRTRLRRDQLRGRARVGTLRRGVRGRRHRSRRHAHQTVRGRGGRQGEIPREFRWVRPDRPRPRTRPAPTVHGRGSARSPTTVRRHRNCHRCASRRRQDHSCSGTEPESFRRRLGAESNGPDPGVGRTRCKAQATCPRLRTQGRRDMRSGRLAMSTSPDC